VVCVGRRRVQGNSPFSYIIVDEVTHTRTILHTPAELLAPNEIESSFLDGGTSAPAPSLHLFCDSRLTTRTQRRYC
jgi:hypothetical protein